MSSIIFTPHEVGLAGYKAAKRAIEFGDVGIPLTISGCDISDYVAPFLPWELIGLQAQTHNGKSFFVDWFERMTAEFLKSKNQEGDIVHISHEESVEAMAFTEYGRLLDVLPAKLARGEYKDLNKIEIAMKEIDGSRIFRIADCAGNDEDDNFLTLTNVDRALTALQEGQIADKRKLRLVVDDYLQAHPADGSSEEQERLQIRNDVYKLRKMAKRLIVPIIVCIQAKQKLEGARPPYLIPGMYDGQGSSTIGQRCDRLLSLWMPKNDYPVGSPVYSGSQGNQVREFDVTEEMCYLKVNKQRGGLPSGKTFELRMDFQKREYVGKFGKPVGEK
jgi:replicative DNA helicase